MSIVFAYQPVVGPLSGASFEEQTVAFFQAVQADYLGKMAEINSVLKQVQGELEVVRGNIRDNAEAIAVLQQRCVDIEEDIAGNANDIAIHTAQIEALQATAKTHARQIAALQNDVAAIQTDWGVPAGFIGLFNSATLPMGYYRCDGTNNTPDLSNYVSGSLNFIRKA